MRFSRFLVVFRVAHWLVLPTEWWNTLGNWNWVSKYDLGQHPLSFKLACRSKLKWKYTAVGQAESMPSALLLLNVAWRQSMPGSWMTIRKTQASDNWLEFGSILNDFGQWPCLTKTAGDNVFYQWAGQISKLATPKTTKNRENCTLISQQRLGNKFQD